MVKACGTSWELNIFCFTTAVALTTNHTSQLLFFLYTQDREDIVILVRALLSHLPSWPLLWPLGLRAALLFPKILPQKGTEKLHREVSESERNGCDVCRLFWKALKRKKQNKLHHIVGFLWTLKYPHMHMEWCNTAPEIQTRAALNHFSLAGVRAQWVSNGDHESNWVILFVKEQLSQLSAR